MRKYLIWQTGGKVSKLWPRTFQQVMGRQVPDMTWPVHQRKLFPPYQLNGSNNRLRFFAAAQSSKNAVVYPAASYLRGAPYLVINYAFRAQRSRRTYQAVVKGRL